MDILTIQGLLTNTYNNLKGQRNKLLKDSDKYLLADFPITSDNLAKVKTYRQELRDYPDNNTLENFLTSKSLPDLPQFPF